VVAVAVPEHLPVDITRVATAETEFIPVELVQQFPAPAVVVAVAADT
jgi:hypothetical protein